MIKRAFSYLVELTRGEHDKNSHAGDLFVILAVLFCGVAIGAYQLGYEQAQDATIGASVTRKCPASTDTQDILEHVWSHRGEVFYRECVVVERPSPIVHTARQQ